MAPGPRKPRCPECNSLLPRGLEQGPCRRCGWEEADEEAYQRRTKRGTSRRREGRGKKGQNPLLVGIALGGATAVALIIVFSMARGKGKPKKRELPNLAVAKTNTEVAKTRKPEKPVDPKTIWKSRFERTLADLKAKRGPIKGETLAGKMRSLRREAISFSDNEARKKIVDLWIELDPSSKEARKFRGDVLYTGPFRRRVLSDGNKRWALAKNPRTGETRDIWITKGEQEALDQDTLYRTALDAVDTVKRIDKGYKEPVKGKKLSIGTWFFFDDDVAPRPFFVCSQSKTPALARDRAKAVVKLLAKLRTSMLADYRELMKMPKGRQAPLVPVFVFAGSKAYNGFRKRSSIKGLPDPMQAAGFFTWNSTLSPVGWLFVWSERPENHYFHQVIAHEGTHLLQFQYTNRSKNSWGGRSDGTTTWFQEGLAEYWGGHALMRINGKEIFVPGAVQKGRLGFLLKYLPKSVKDIPKKEPRFMPLRSMCRTSYSAYFSQYQGPSASGNLDARTMVSMFYAQGWAFVHFLMNYKDGKYRKAVLRYMKTELSREFKWRLLQKSLGKSGRPTEIWNQLTEEFIQYVNKDLRGLLSGGGKERLKAEAERLLKAMEKREKTSHGK